ncbi:hypothetical protein FC69_GL000734 [Latilactobacillus fuchuensis DSM 14340 = JCM 11249]|uniref:Uncharacterized protein n=1 Tax=Latilactobacillus fuchuensis DSM 14340 = JCM 11249 TaxID=1423747 RepID=A0A0R1RWW9_9LACO|nr:hypothetical protein FC69_GL000734 [Latilactobacillus fuchuensis DSM 14340 = JCM 11249]
MDTILIATFLIIFLSIVLFATIASQLTFKIGLVTNCVLFIILVGVDAYLFSWSSGLHWTYFIISLLALIASELLLAEFPHVND